MKHTILVAAGLFAAVLAFPALAQQASGPGSPDSFESLGAAVDIHRFQTDFAIGSNTYNGEVDELGLAFRQYFGHDFSLAMEAGYTTMSMDGNPATQGLSPHGYYGRLTARYQWWLGEHLGLEFTGTGGYHRLHDSSANSDVVERWWSYSAAGGLRYRINWFSVAGGLVYRHASGDESGSSTSGQPSLGFARTTNPYLDVDFTVTDHGTFGIHVEGGARRSVALVFGYRFVAP